MALRKIITAEERDRKSKRNMTIISILLASILLLSTAGYFVFDFTNSNSGKIEYKGVEFTQTDYGTWSFNAYGVDFQTRYNPLETLNISVLTSKNFQAYNSQALYLSANPIEDISVVSYEEILRNFASMLSRYNLACFEESCGQDYPIKNCEDNMILFKSSNNSRVYDVNGCVTIEYASGEELMVADAFLFKVLGF